MADRLFPVIKLQGQASAPGQYDKKDRRSYQWDFEKGDFSRNGANQVMECSGQEAYRTWCIKAVETQRRTCPAYPDEIGSEMEAAFRKPSQKAQESSIERTIKETLMVNPRTEYVRDFSFKWDSDSVRVSFLVKGIDQDGFRIDL